ncbi:hypothetical protein [Corynebacterium glyciniphilum]|uniref:hypothetical protein n=1 Tax=Corynebacterium glyciniphilum TaxID=1404244 RepID=UPI00264B7324|nr:hypothetical protein [Corynebacterium glyciniphilum]MDN6706929.1 hypothetical protein [Corynebacterium glyciniphilum]
MNAHIEYGVQEKIDDSDEWEDWEVPHFTYEDAKRSANGMEYFRVVKRAVTDWEVVE